MHERTEATKMSLWYVASFPLDQYQAWLNAAHFGQDMGRVDTSFAHLSRAFREPFARNRKKKQVDTISYLVFRGSSANLSPTCTFLERYLSRRHFKSMPVDLDYIKPFMGFCATLIYIHISISHLFVLGCKDVFGFLMSCVVLGCIDANCINLFFVLFWWFSCKPQTTYNISSHFHIMLSYVIMINFNQKGHRTSAFFPAMAPDVHEDPSKLFFSEDQCSSFPWWHQHIEYTGDPPHGSSVDLGARYLKSHLGGQQLESTRTNMLQK